MSAPLVILVNAQAGALHPTATPADIEAAAAGLGLAVEVIPCDSPDDMRRRLRAAAEEGAERIAVAGGDGTVALAVQELAHTPTALGILPQGTANNFATSLHLPQDLAEALGVLQAGRVRTIDLGKVGSRYFTESAGVGLFADALLLYGPRTGKSLPRLIYAVARILFSLHAHRLRLQLDDEVVVERALMCTVANSPRLGLGAPVAPDALLTDGHLDVVVIGDLTRFELVRYYLAVMNESHLDLPKVSSAKARRVKIDSPARLQVHCDDKIVGTTPAVITAEAGALRVIVGAT